MSKARDKANSTVSNFASTGIDDNADANAITIDSSENVMVGATSNNSANVGHGFQADGFVYHTRDGGAMLRLNRLSSDGEIQQFQKGGTLVGSIGTATNELEIKTSGSRYLELQNIVAVYNSDWTGNLQMSPTVSSVDLGNTSNQWDNLYLSGGAYIGGTGSANYLDDYEEGLSTVTVTPQTSGSITLYGSTNQLSYTKIGRSVHVQCELQVQAVSSPVGIYINIIGLPFTIASLTDLGERFGGGLLFHPGGGSASVKPFFGFSGTQFLIYVDASTVTVNTSIDFTFSYLTT